MNIDTPHLAEAIPDTDPREAAVFHKIGWRLVPILGLAYLVNYLDRTNIGFAALTMNQQIGLDARQFGFGSGLFFVSYCLFEIPSNIAMHYIGARRWVARIMITWGLSAVVTAFVVGPNSFYGARLLLGAAEAGFFPGVTLYLSNWFPVHYRARILAWFLLAIPVSSLVGGPISGALIQVNQYLGLAGWQWMFIVEGLPAAVIGGVVLFVLADSPAKAKWLTADEKRIAQASIAAERRERPRGKLLEMLADPRVHILALVQLGFTIGSYGIGIWLPQILKTADLSSLDVGLLIAIPYAVASVAMILWARHVDHRGHVVSNLAIACLVGAIGLGVSALFSKAALLLTGITLALIGVTAARAIFWTIPGRFLTGIGAAAGFGYINTVAAFGGFLGPAMIGWIKGGSSSFAVGLAMMGGIMLLTTLAALLLFSRRTSHAGADA